MTAISLPQENQLTMCVGLMMLVWWLDWLLPLFLSSLVFTRGTEIDLARVMVAVISRRIAAWSLTPTTSSVRFASDGRFVKTRSRQFFSRVFTCTICSSLGLLSCSGKGRLGIWDISLYRGWAWWNQLPSHVR